MAKSDITFQVQLDKQVVDYFKQTAPEKLQLARRRAVEAAGMVWADTAKEITRDDNHIDTSLYINSIGHVTDIPPTHKSGKPGRNATEGDVIYELNEGEDRTVLAIGSAVSYASHLEKKYNIMARALDTGQGRMKKLAEIQIQQTLFGG
ncbi:hypothetical protein [Aneurinibacillus aneurinilyticus]|uniref:HK97 gp10 family phage protein n=1 Tax=Aneurinibacillus aneurinilyticus TaxID=1391 RepID=A0A848D2P5_ANEAE|nr:hypothetical protein [Aneurinibacillus aneurinilyticus]NMF00237.1 hypothetical protein [Aneurinibacillus aneurinilyticus]